MKAYMKIVKAEPIIKTNMDSADYVVILRLKKDVPVDDEDWRIIPCPKCGQECQITPEDELLIERGARYICTECVLGARKEQKTMTMTIERAIEILDPTHRERYSDLPDGMEQVNEACCMGMEALKQTAAKRILLRLHEAGGCDAQDDYSKGWDKAITEAIRIVETETGIKIGEVLD